MTPLREIAAAPTPESVRAWFAANPVPAPMLPICPDCSAQMLLRTGRYGRFYGCSRFPSCHGATSL